jgi:hypothetical protein
VHVKLALLADSANVSQEGKLNLLGIFDTIYAREFPTAHPHMYLVLRFEAGADEAGTKPALEVQFLGPDGEPLFRIPATLNVQRGVTGRAVGIDHVLALANLGFERAGRYAFRVLLDGRLAAEVPLAVETLPATH